MRVFVKQAIVLSVLLMIIALVMSIGQWLTAPEGNGADAWSHALLDRGHESAASTLRVARAVGEVRLISAIVNSPINAPRDRLLRALGYMKTENAHFFYATPHRLFSDDWRAILMFALGTFAVYFPLVLFFAALRMKSSRSKSRGASPRAV
jgi:hypothetical protein